MGFPMFPEKWKQAQNTEIPQTIRATINNLSTTTESLPQKSQQPKVGAKCIFLVPNPRPRFCCC